MPSHADALKAERDELLAALKNLLGWYISLRQFLRWSDDVEEIHEARQAIANASHPVAGKDPPSEA